MRKQYSNQPFAAFMVVVMWCTFFTGFAQQKRPANRQDKLPATPASGKSKKVLRPDVFLGNSSLNGGKISTATFREHMQQGLTARDSAGNRYKVAGFNFGYYERNSYEDSAANPITIYDYDSRYCIGDTLPGALAENVYQHIKTSDTVVFDRVLVTRLPAPAHPDTFVARGMRFYFGK